MNQMRYTYPALRGAGSAFSVPGQQNNGVSVQGNGILPLPEDLIMTAVSLGEIGMTDKLHMPCKTGIGGNIRQTEDLAEGADAIGFKHIDIPAMGDPVFDFVV